MDNEVLRILRKCLHLDLDVDEKSLNTDLEQWDSLKQIQIVIEIEECFNISIPDSDFMYLTSFDDICQYLKNRNYQP
jgi:acyl carrier protein